MQKQQKPLMRMKPLDRVLCITAALFGIGGKEQHMDNTDRIIAPP
jgi:hypothetical protein